MAKATATKKTAASKKKAPEPEVVDEELELDEVDGDEVEETPTKKGGQQEVEFGASDLAKLLGEKAGKPVSTRELRTLIRKMARDGSGRVDREIKAGNRTRYSWSGPEDPEVKAIIAAFDGGELEADKQAKLAELKENKAKKKAAKDAEKAAAEAKGSKGGKKGKNKAAAPVEEAEDDDLELEEDED